ncbi:uncharacterized protein LOC135698027 [Ochlerotatus camptorhynchus]|uniref:uncharacterized protein LOC135698027 n=1 Tax=Ochlerotatus camptorhynchus TaxID=644619 RepID=UPI0031D54923
MLSVRLIILLKIFILFAIAKCNTACNDTQPTSSCEAHSREKRYLSFVINGGVAKFVVGGVFPVFFHHKLKRSLNAAVNLQANYAIPPKIIWPVPEHIFRERLNQDFTDNSRPQLYRLLERMIDSWGRNGRTCLLRTICEMADTPLSHNGMFGEILDVIFSPNDSDDIDNEYVMARKYGTHGVSCSEVFRECPYGHGLLDAITTLNPFKF